MAARKTPTPAVRFQARIRTLPHAGCTEWQVIDSEAGLLAGPVASGRAQRADDAQAQAETALREAELEAADDAVEWTVI